MGIEILDRVYGRKKYQVRIMGGWEILKEIKRRNMSLIDLWMQKYYVGYMGKIYQVEFMGEEILDRVYRRRNIRSGLWAKEYQCGFMLEITGELYSD